MYEDEHLEAQYDDNNGAESYDDEPDEDEEEEYALWADHHLSGWLQIMYGTLDEVLAERDFRRDKTVPGVWKNFAVSHDGKHPTEFAY